MWCVCLSTDQIVTQVVFPASSLSSQVKKKHPVLVLQSEGISVVGEGEEEKEDGVRSKRKWDAKEVVTSGSKVECWVEEERWCE